MTRVYEAVSRGIVAVTWKLFVSQVTELVAKLMLLAMV
jgi:hypothetical protein